MMAAVAQRRTVRLTAALAALLLATAFVVADAGAARAVEPSHTISGTIHLPAGVSASVYGGMQVVVVDSAQNAQYFPEVALDGTYSIPGLAADTYSVQFITGVYYEPPLGYDTPTPVSCGWYNAQPDWGTPTPVDITGSDATGIDFTCTKLMSISGTVALGAGTDGSWLGGVTAHAAGLHDSGQATVNSATGAYTINGLVAGDYTVSFTAAHFTDGTSEVYPNLLSEYYDDAAAAVDATTVPVTTADVTGIDATLDRGYSISGHVSVPDGTTSSWTQGVSVSATGTAGTFAAILSPSGDYSIYGLAAGSYTVEFAVADYYYDENAGVYVELGIPTEFYNDAAYVADATPVPVSNANVNGIDAVLETGNHFDQPPTPVITGGPAVGSLLGVSPGSWNPGPSLLEYQWLRNGVEIAGASQGNYTIQLADRGTDITVTLTGSLDGYASASVTSAALAVPADPFVTTPVPSITGILKSGYTLTRATGTWAPTATLATQWKRNGVAIAGATGSTYKLTTTDRGANITVTVTATKAGYVTTAKTSSAKYVPRVFTTTPVPTITGTLKSGYTLTAHKGTWSPTPTTLTYQWYRNGVKITNATKYTYKLTTLDKAKRITVTVTGKRTGYTTVTKTSAYKTIAR